MKILLSSVYHISSPQGGGNEQYLHQLALALTKKGHQITYLTSKAENTKNYPYKIIISPIPHFLGKPLISLTWIQLIKEIDFDIFHAAGSGLALLHIAHFIKQKLKKPTILTYQGDSHPGSKILKIASNIEHNLIPICFKQIIVTTPMYQSKLKSQWPKKDISFIPMMVSPHIKNLKISKVKARKKLNLKNKKTILFIGKLSSHQYYKGINILINSAKYLGQDYQIIIIGDGDKKQYWQDYAKDKGFDHKIKFVGYVDNSRISNYLKASSLFVLPSTSDSEGFGLVLIEAMRCMIPTLTTKVIGSAKWFEQRGITNFVKANNSKSLAAKIKKTTNSPDKKQIKKAYEFSLKFTPAKMAINTLKIYENSKKINTLFLNENPLPSKFTKGSIAGKELRLRALINQIDKIHVISRQGSSVVDINNKKIGDLEKKVTIQLLSKWPYYFATLPLFISGFIYCLKNKPKLIEAESPILSGPAAVLLGLIFKIPTIVEYRASYEELIKQKLAFIPLGIKQEILNSVQFWTMKNTNAVIANSQYYQNYLKKNKIDSVVINPGLQYVPTKIKKFKNKIITIGYLGRIEKEKGILFFLEAIKILLADKNISNFKIEIAGIGSMQKTLINKIKDYKLDKTVKYLGFSNNYKTLTRWDIFVNPNILNHPLEMVNVEAAYCSLPVVTFGNPQIPETVIHNKTGIKVKNKTSKDLAKAIKKLILNKQLRQKLSNDSRQFALANYDMKTQANKLANLYQQLDLI